MRDNGQIRNGHVPSERARRSPRPCHASANRLRQYGHSPWNPLISAENAVHCGSVMIALKTNELAVLHKMMHYN